MHYKIAIVCLLCFHISCGPTGPSTFVKQITPTNTPLQTYETEACKDKMAYLPNTSQPSHTPIRHIRVNFHIMRRADGSQNFSTYEARAYVHKLLEIAQYRLQNNKRMNLPLGNNTPVYPTRYRYVLTPRPGVPGDDGIYIHDDDELYYMRNKGKGKNNYSKAVFDKYGIQKDTVLNVFVMSYDDKDLRTKPHYNLSNNGIAFRNWCKVSTMYFAIQKAKQEFNPDKEGSSQWLGANNLNHEIGHVIGLSHTWRSNDGCDDTPKHTNCWNYAQQPPCDKKVSNNVMDYNTYQSAWSPCQIAIVHHRMSQKRYPIRRLLVPVWCKRNPSQTIHIRRSTIWHSAKDLEGDLVIHNGAQLTIRCRVSVPPSGRISIHPSGRLILDGATLENACGLNWLGIEAQVNGQDQGQVQYINAPTITHATHEIKIN